ncbi:MAG: hypothetical protein GY796_09080 [Chloroflexi bacterium]|nr:hypothetical protein [Chloroflexota bacterium]
MSDLEEFVLDYLQEAGGIVEPPAYNVYEALLPETVADRWRVPDYLRLAFAETEQEDVTRLGYNHPLVEQMVEEAYGRSASSRLYINNLRLNKSSVDELAMKSWAVLNARTQPLKRATVARVRSAYVRFNFKAAILSDEKQERLVSVLMDAHTGSRVIDSDPIESRATADSPDTVLASLSSAPIRWQPKDGPTLNAPLDENTLSALLDRAQTSVLQEMQAELGSLQKRVVRFRQLDEARLTDYYDTLEKDLQNRLRTASAERRPGLEDKLTAVQTERRHKLTDLTERYQVRINLTLLNLLIIQQPKLIQAVRIVNRSTKVSAYAVWDPLLLQLEPLHCQMCGQPGQRLYLCHNGHLAHEDCLAPACIDCKRVFCRDCAHEVKTCDVCHEPLCHYSQLACSDCDRHTCQEHRELCHADNGRPLDLTTQTLPPPEPAPPAKPKTSPTSRKSRPKRPSRKPKPKPKSKTVRIARSGPKVLRMEVILSPTAVAAYLIGKRGHQIAFRVWELDPDEGGILRNCECEKGDACQAGGIIIRPFESRYLEKQMRDELTAFAEEYGLPTKKIHYNRLSSLNNEPYPVAKFGLFGLWKNEEVLAAARDTFSNLYW